MQAWSRRQKCSVCALKLATKVTYEDTLIPETPAFWCSDCYEALHYDATGKLVSQHRVFPYSASVS